MKTEIQINEQTRRIIELANSLGGKYVANAKHRVDTQYYWQMARRVKNQNGIYLFAL